jgi:hypothetical protein
MKEQKNWIFDGLGFIPESVIGILLRGATARTLREEPTLVGLELQKRVVMRLNELTGGDIKPCDFLATGSHYFKTATGREEARKLRQYVKEQSEMLRRKG